MFSPNIIYYNDIKFTREVGRSNLLMTNFFFFVFSETCWNLQFIQAQKHQIWSKFHLKLQKEPKIYMMGS
jgi:hypothetical protein